ncbi:TerC family protein [Terrarubrum flagellatum]|uniref:TerC family protein n=1 Tax=Terrirubrum flagellatum TaxID=2895980 RepID=UPI0031452FB5
MSGSWAELFANMGVVGKALEIIGVNIILSGDNAVVIALACRGLPPEQRKWGMILGAGVAVALRIVFTVVIASLLGAPYLRIVGALLLFWIAIKLIIEDNEGKEDEIKASDKLWKAVQTVAIADVVMSLDNVIAIAAVAKDSTTLLILGLLISIPLIVVGAGLIMSLLSRFPILVWAGAALLGWVAGEMFLGDPKLLEWLQSTAPHLVHQVGADQSATGKEAVKWLEYTAAIIGAVFVVAVAYILKKRAPEGHAA